MNDYDKEEYKDNLPDYCERELEPSHKEGFYVCPNCGSGTGKHHTSAFHVYRGDDGTWLFNCSRCGIHGDIYNLVMIREGCTFSEALNRVQEMYGTPDTKPMQVHREYRKREPLPAKLEPEVPSLQWQQALMKIADRAKEYIFEDGGADGLAYMKSRGIDERTIREHGIGYIPQIRTEQWFTDNGYAFSIPSPTEEGKRIAIPCGITCPFMMGEQLYKLEVRRLPKHLVNDSIDKIGQPKGGKTALFNADDALCSDRRRDILFTEGWMDALSINQAVGRWCNDEIKAVTFGGVNAQGDPDEFYRWYVLPYRILVGFDNDEAGRTRSAELVEKISQARRNAGRTDAGTAFPPKQYKDWNEFLVKDEGAVFEYVSNLFPETEYIGDTSHVRKPTI